MFGYMLNNNSINHNIKSFFALQTPAARSRRRRRIRNEISDSHRTPSSSPPTSFTNNTSILSTPNCNALSSTPVPQSLSATEATSIATTTTAKTTITTAYTDYTPADNTSLTTPVFEHHHQQHPQRRRRWNNCLGCVESSNRFRRTSTSFPSMLAARLDKWQIVVLSIIILLLCCTSEYTPHPYRYRLIV